MLIRTEVLAEIMYALFVMLGDGHVGEMLIGTGKAMKPNEEGLTLTNHPLRGEGEEEMSKSTHTTYYCDNELYCSSEQDSGSWLPLGWVKITYRPKEGLQKHGHYCSIHCLKQGADYLEDD